jgi:phosphoribosyl 1,2-cyclic phosphate phosphodiesterase
MKFIITGSGGCVCTPKPLCQCNVCVEARKKGYPYKRCGCSLFLEDISLLVDTPEDIAIAINNADIKRIDNILYSHWDPDHTLGIRIMEQLRLEWLDYYDKIKPETPISIFARADVMSDVNQIRSKYGSLLDYYEHMGLITRTVVNSGIEINDIKISFIPVQKSKAVSVFVFESDGKKIVYAQCDCVPFPNDNIIKNADVLIIGNTYIGNVLKNGRVITDVHPLHNELHNMSDIQKIIETMEIKNTIITHIEEDWGKSYSDYLELEKQYTNIKFAYDGMIVEL